MRLIFVQLVVENKVNNLQGIVYKIKEDMEIYRLLNIFDENSYVYTVVQRDYTPHKYW